MRFARQTREDKKKSENIRLDENIDDIILGNFCVYLSACLSVRMSVRFSVCRCGHSCLCNQSFEIHLICT